MARKFRRRNPRWRVIWTANGLCNGCHEFKEGVFATHAELLGIYPPMCGDCYRQWKSDSKNPDLPWSCFGERDPTIDY